MISPSSFAAAPPQPDLGNYTPDALALFKAYTRDSYLTEFGMQAPPWDPTRPPKTWFDSAATIASTPSSMVGYSIVALDPRGVWSLLPMTLEAQDAATINLPGAVVYPPYQPASTKATRGGQTLNPVYMVLEADARSVMAEVGGNGFFDEGASVASPGYPQVIYPADELRRMWAFQVSGHQYFAGLLLASKNALGTGWPGHWDFSRGYPSWVPDPTAPTGILDTRSPVAMPVRALLPNERLQAGPMGLGVMVVRTDLEAAKPESSGFLPEDRATIQKILEIVSRPAA